MNNTSNSINGQVRRDPRVGGYMEPIMENGDAQDEYEASKSKA